MRACIKFGGNLMHVSGFLSGGSFMGVEAFHFEWELHPHECGRGGGSPHGWAPCPLGAPLSPIKGPPLLLSKHTSSRRISLPPFRISPWSRISEIHVPGGFFWKDLLLPLLRWSEGAEVVGVPQTCVRSRMHHCFAVLDVMVLDRLDQMDF